MKKYISIVKALIACMIVMSISTYAGSIEGTVTSVDANAKALAIAQAEGVATVSYTDTTTWPADVTDPSSLVGKKVIVNTDDAAGSATSVSLSK